MSAALSTCILSWWNDSVCKARDKIAAALIIYASLQLFGNHQINYMTYLNGALENCTPTNKNNITLGQTDLQAYTSIIQIYFSTAKDFYTSYC